MLVSQVYGYINECVSGVVLNSCAKDNNVISGQRQNAVKYEV